MGDNNQGVRFSVPFLASDSTRIGNSRRATRKLLRDETRPSAVDAVWLWARRGRVRRTRRTYAASLVSH